MGWQSHLDPIDPTDVGISNEAGMPHPRTSAHIVHSAHESAPGHPAHAAIEGTRQSPSQSAIDAGLAPGTPSGHPWETTPQAPDAAPEPAQDYAERMEEEHTTAAVRGGTYPKPSSPEEAREWSGQEREYEAQFQKPKEAPMGGPAPSYAPEDTRSR